MSTTESANPAFGLDADVKTVSVNSVRWLCPRCFHANPACPSALGHVFVCEKCGTQARVVMRKERGRRSLHEVFCELQAALIQTNDAEMALRENRLLDCEKSIRAIRVHILESLKTLEPHSQNVPGEPSDCAPLGLLGGVSLHWREEKPDREGWWVCAAKKDNSLHIGFVTKKDIELVNGSMPWWLGDGKWCGPLLPPNN